VSLEGFVDATVVVEGLKKAGSNPTREKFIDAIESMRDFDAGLGTSMHLMYSPHRHQGFDHVYPTVVTGGKPQLINDWQSVVKRQ
jgi:branched-chain amino acid transport system substrate-binding protein